MSGEKTRKLTVVRTDGFSHTSQFGGWHGASAADNFFNQAKADKRTLFAVLFEADGPSCQTWHVITEYAAPKD